MKKLIIDLTGGITDYQQDVYGKGIFYQTGSADIYVKYNDRFNDSELLKPKSFSSENFSRLYITGNAQETITLYVLENDEDKIEYPVQLAGNLSSALDAGQFSINSTASIIWSAVDTVREGTIRNNGNSTVYVGKSNVTPANGYPLKSGEALALNYYTGNLYAVCDAGNTSDIRMLRLL